MSIWLSAPKCPAGKLPAPIRELVYVLLARQDPALAAIRAGQERGLKKAARTGFSGKLQSRDGYPRLRYSTVQYGTVP